MNVADELVERALAAGFDLAALAPLRPPRDAQRFDAWVASGRHADMAWLERQRERILDPRRIDPRARTILVVGAGHARERVTLEGGGEVARYAAGRDYHNVMTRRLRRLARGLVADGLAGPSRSIVDAGPLLERSHAAEAGLGFPSKAANLLHVEHGPWFFLGELLLDLELQPTALPPAASCGTCTACLDACPTDAIEAPGLVDARRCLSYHNIENRGTIPHALRPKLDAHVFGCDVCSEVCPWGKDAPDRSAEWGTHPAVEGGRLVDWLTLDAARFRERFEGSALRRPRRDGLARNAALVLGNRPSDEGRASLERALEKDAAPLVRAAAAWGLARGHGSDSGVAAALERAAAREDDAGARADMERTRATLS